MERSLRPENLNEALMYRAETGATPFAGGTDLMVRLRGYTGTLPHFDTPVLFLDAVKELQLLSMENGEIRIGASVFLASLLEMPQLPELLRKAVSGIAAPGLRNLATLAGNICNASPAGDGIPPLLIHNSRFKLITRNNERWVAATDFFTGPGKTVLANDEILAEIRVPLLPEGSLYYRKVGTRKANALSKLSVAGYSQKEGRHITDFRFALGAVAPTVIRPHRAEALVIEGAPMNRIIEAAEKEIHPINDQRSTATYRKQTALNALEEFLTQISYR